MMFPPRGPSAPAAQTLRAGGSTPGRDWSGEAKEKCIFFGGKMEQTRVEVVVLRYFEQIQFF